MKCPSCHPCEALMDLTETADGDIYSHIETCPRCTDGSPICVECDEAMAAHEAERIGA